MSKVLLGWRVEFYAAQRNRLSLMDRYQSIKIWQKTLLKLRMLTIIEKKSAVRILDTLLRETLEEKGVYFFNKPTTDQEKEGSNTTK